MAMLVTLAKFKEAIGENSDANDGKHTEAIEDASSLIIQEAQRNFAETQAVATRTYKYDGSGVLEIDDCELPTAVTGGGATFAAGRWIARKEGPADIPVYSYLELPFLHGDSGEMGFTRNEDVILANASRREIDVTVTANFGWPAVPDSVQRATIITAASLESEAIGSAAGLAAKSVAEVAENYLQNQVSTDEIIPRKAQAALAPYKRAIL